MFIDVAKNQTTIVRVTREPTSQTRTFSTARAKFTGPERDQLRMIRACHPTVNEFFFAERVILVEGETEHAVLSMLLEDAPGHAFCVVNCMGKANIPMFARILNQFGTRYTILHDSDAPRAKAKGKWKTNAMWTINERIRGAVAERPPALPDCEMIVHVPDFEGYYFGTEQKADKPHAALRRLRSDEFQKSENFAKFQGLVGQLASNQHPCAYKDEASLLGIYSSWLAAAKPAEECWIIAAGATDPVDGGDELEAL